MSTEADERMREALREMDKEDMDPEYFLDDMATEASMDKDQVKKKREEQMYKRQKQIDDVAIAHIIKALEDGVELKGDHVYYELLKAHPHFQVKREQREKRLK